jgi:hypothetical protein
MRREERGDSHPIINEWGGAWAFLPGEGGPWARAWSIWKVILSSCKSWTFPNFSLPHKLLGRLRWEDHLSHGIQGQPGQHVRPCLKTKTIVNDCTVSLYRCRVIIWQSSVVGLPTLFPKFSFGSFMYYYFAVSHSWNSALITSKYRKFALFIYGTRNPKDLIVVSLSGKF